MTNCRLRERLARLRHRPRPEAGSQRQAAVDALRPCAGRAARRPRHVDQRTVRRLAVRHAGARQVRRRSAEAARRRSSRSSIRSPTARSSFDKSSSVFLSNTNHEEDQPVHLRLTDPTIPIRDNLPQYGEPARLYCPAGRLRSGLCATRRSGPTRASSSTRRIACTARPATSRTPRRTSPGPSRRRRRTQLSGHVRNHSFCSLSPQSALKARLRVSRDSPKTNPGKSLVASYLRSATRALALAAFGSVDGKLAGRRCDRAQ